MWTIAPIHVRRGQLPESAQRIDQMTAGAALGTYLQQYSQRGVLDVVVRCAVARFHFFVHVMRGKSGRMAVQSIAGSAVGRTQRGSRR